MPPKAVDAASIFAEAEIVIDANVLLSLYRLSSKTRDSWYQVLDLVSDRVVMPHQVAVEFTRNADASRSEIAGSYDQLLQAARALEGLPKQLFTGSRHHQADRIGLLREQIQAHLAPLIESLIDSRDRDSAVVDAADDVVLAKVTALFASRVLPEPDPQTIRERVADFVAYRAPNRIPPGWRDVAKPTPVRQAGDYLLWAEVLEHAASTNRPVLLVTDDGKDDWWCKANGKMEPAPELAVEFARVTGCVYAQATSVEFFALARSALGLEEDTNALQETAEVVAEAADLQRSIARLNQQTLDALRESTVMPDLAALSQPALDNVRAAITGLNQPAFDNLRAVITGLNQPAFDNVRAVITGLNQPALDNVRAVITGLNQPVLDAARATLSAMPDPQRNLARLNQQVVDAVQLAARVTPALPDPLAAPRPDVPSDAQEIPPASSAASDPDGSTNDADAPDHSGADEG